ncbi:substrate-binding domain-containing protein [Paenibacillus crassostreae]|uniref:Transcriptional regulator n=1 Tax=Paenibacillus crassostreae TaxID=1763538 RepID=A0A167GRP6_9BACL|nr:substrate-binding domain-containing protein [Paenibacillus crassostreae]AOZ92030.1 transcriptional regulator [Paenibacillus crassostreae]OAB77839.1 transcriptional regulator [Paenibacillus crassostreae]
MKGKVTVQEIADLAGVSKFAVSRALSGKSGVSVQTREMILKVAGQLGYFKNEPKRLGNRIDDNKSQKSTGTILVLFPNVRYQNNESLYWGPVFDGISTRLNQKGLDILTLTEPTSDNLFSLLNPDAIQGIITVGSITTSILLDIHRLNIPVVMVDHMDPAYHCDSIFSDNFMCMKELMTKLYSKGYKKYQYIGNIKDAASFNERWIAYQTSLVEFNIENSQILSLLGSDTEHYESIATALRTGELPDVFVCANDTTAFYIIDTLQQLGIEVPNQCAVTGFDNTHKASPILATVDVKIEILGMRAVDQILWRIDNHESPFEKKLLYADTILREDYNKVHNIE